MTDDELRERRFYQRFYIGSVCLSLAFLAAQVALLAVLVSR
jgi:hypothetical protein